MRVAVLITTTLVPGTTALLESVIRPVSDAFVDWASRKPEDNRRNTARPNTARETAGDQRELAMRDESTMGEQRQLSWAHLD